MRLCVDENSKRSLTNLLEQEGSDVGRVQGELDLGFEDAEIVASCREGERISLTEVPKNSA